MALLDGGKTGAAEVAPVDLIRKIQQACGPDLIRSDLKKLRPENAHRTWGCCYVATEALYHTWGKKLGYKPQRLRYTIPGTGVGCIHWYLKRDNQIADPTVEQFDDTPDYINGKGGNFLSVKPSKRCQTILERIGWAK